MKSVFLFFAMDIIPISDMFARVFTEFWEKKSPLDNELQREINLELLDIYENTFSSH